MSGLIYTKNHITLGITANIMFFLVGWHYVKQGYGMLMLDAALKKYFFASAEKTIFLRNAYAIWFFAWMLANYVAKTSTPNYFGIPYQAINIPNWAISISALLATATTLQTLLTLNSILQSKRKIAWNGVIAYGVSLYAWLLVRDPIIVLWIPLFHSLQYLAVTCKFQFRKAEKETHKNINYRYQFYLNIVIAFLLGYLFFIQIPGWMDAYINYDKEIFGHSLFLFVFWIFINIHHYLMDTVMWRKGNPDVQKYLFQ